MWWLGEHYSGDVSLNSPSSVLPTNPEKDIPNIGTQGNNLKVFCSGVNCGSINENTYSGSGVGIWQHDNTTSIPKNVNISIYGVEEKNIYTALVNTKNSPVNISNSNLNMFLEVQSENIVHNDLVPELKNDQSNEQFYLEMNEFANDSINTLKVNSQNVSTTSFKMNSAKANFNIIYPMPAKNLFLQMEDVSF